MHKIAANFCFALLCNNKELIKNIKTSPQSTDTELYG